MYVTPFLHRLQSSWLVRVLGLLLAIAVMALSSSYLTRDIRLAAGNHSDYPILLFHWLAWTLWLSLLWLSLSLRRRALPRLEARLLLRSLFEVTLCASYAVLSVELTHLVLSHAFVPPDLPGQLSVEDFKPMMMMRSAGMHTFAVVTITAISGMAQRRRSESAARALLYQKATLERQLTAARLETLQAQLNPHFLFNALHAIGGVILSGDRQQAHRALASLSTLLRQSLKQGDKHTTTVESELELVRNYLELEQLRFGDRMQFTVEASVDLMQACVPSLVLLPIVENAVTHGLEPRSGGGHIELCVSELGGGIELRVTDDGVGRSHPSRQDEQGTGIGLKNTSSRLEALYGRSASVTVEDRAPRGTRVSIKLPFVRQATAPERGLAS